MSCNNVGMAKWPATGALQAMAAAQRNTNGETAGRGISRRKESNLEGVGGDGERWRNSCYRAYAWHRRRRAATRKSGENQIAAWRAVAALAAKSAETSKARVAT